MIYDVHTHVGIDPGFYLRGWWPYASTAQDLLALMDANGVDRAVVFPLCLSSAYDVEAFVRSEPITLLPGRVPYDRENGLLIREVQRLDPAGRLRVLAMFDPSRKADEQALLLEQHVPHIAGLKLQATVIESRVASLLDEGKVILNLAQQHDLPVLIHTSYLASDRYSPLRDCLDVAAAFPKVRFNLAHSLRFHAPSLKETRGLDNVWVDCSAHLAHCDLAKQNTPIVAAKGERVDADYGKPAEVLQAVAATLRPGRYLWGSDNPFQSWCDNDVRIIHEYREEVGVLKQLPAPLQTSMADGAIRAWLGKREQGR